jgi:hypothetical protein
MEIQLLEAENVLTAIIAATLMVSSCSMLPSAGIPDDQPAGTSQEDIFQLTIG